MSFNNLPFCIDPNKPPHVTRNGLSSEILVLRLNLEYFGIEFTNLGSPNCRTITYSIPKDYIQGRVPVYNAMRIKLGYDDNPLENRRDRNDINKEIAYILKCYITLDDLYNVIIEEEKRINGPISDHRYAQLWKDNAEKHLNIVLTSTIRNEVITTDEMSKRMINFFKIIGQTTRI